METPENQYILSHSTPEEEALRWITRQTHIRTHYPRMLSGPVQGRLLRMLTELTGAKRVLDIGTFTGYSAVCLALGLSEGGHVDTLENNDELEDLIREGFDRAGVAGRISLHIGNALDLRDRLSGEDPYDLVFIDADKREYPEYYAKVFPLVRPGGLILADDVLWDGKPYAETVPEDAQTRGICRFNELVAADPRVETVLLPLRHGLSLIRKK